MKLLALGAGRGRSIGAALAVALVIGGAGFALAHDGAEQPVDLTRLPLGDRKISSEPKQGWLWACFVQTRAPSGAVVGRWIRSDGTFDLTAKAVVGGTVSWPLTVSWPYKFTLAIDGDKRVFTSNDLPQHSTGVFPISRNDSAFQFDRNPNSIRAQAVEIELPLNPVVAPSPSCALGVVGILLTGVMLFNAFDAIGYDAVAHELQDSCQGHPQESGTYHYHSVTKCIEDKRAPDGHSGLVGYALDGFGIFGHYGEGGKTLTSADLDACHGHTHKIMWDGKVVEIYHYHATWDFPYTVGCMRGAVSLDTVAAVSGGGPPDRGPHPNLARAATLGISVDRLRAALGPPPPDFAAAAARLGVDEETLRRSLAPDRPPPPQ